MKTSIALIGFMGTGKTTVGRILAEKTGKEFLELDARIEAEAGMTITGIFEKEGETGFRRREMAVIEKLTGRKNAIIACGGGVVLNTINVERLKEECRMVCLTASIDAILERTEKEKTRPLLETGDRVSRIKELLDKRESLYRQAAEIIIDTTRLSPGQVADGILAELNEL